ncbi:fibronectin type III domain-containing protein [Paenibacillus sp. FSL H7-0331]|uniref:fibronectin type III domain-containing protein n=1 Tax=Paenibacillus sp. FSL H7-0331 TaxID=1920421 RepID=UPI00096CCBD5|nr:hypothetical protein [Paenibacillus sp. FSL H7-0331]OMF08400.1 hypothetical protein BK127_28765 [Paenibacillus sp. FSL H7-0331]
MKYFSVLIFAIITCLLVPVSSVFAAPIPGNILIDSYYGIIETPDTPYSVTYSNLISAGKTDVDGNDSTTNNISSTYWYYVKVSNTPTTITSIRYYASQAVTLAFYDGTSNTRLFTYTIAANDPSYHSINVPNVKIVATHVNTSGTLREWYVSNVVQIPSVPLGLSAAPSNAQIDLSWTNVTGATGYNVKRSTTAGGPYTTVASNVAGSPYTDTTVTNGTTYYYVISAVNNAGEGASSNEASAKPTAPVVPAPDAPINLIAVAGNAQVNLTWPTVTGATGYNIKRSTTPSGPYTTVANNVYGSPYTDTAVTNGITYYYVVTALDASGESGNSNEASATPMGTSRIILTTTMTNGDTFEYNLSQTELTTFLAWFDAKAAGTGPAKYSFTNQHLKGSFLARKNSLIFDKILKFNYDEYSISGSGTPTEVAEVTAGTALSITLTDGKVEEFILSAADYNAFVAWHDAKSAGTGPARYTFENPLKKGPFLARHEVVIFDKISSYDSEDFN